MDGGTEGRTEGRRDGRTEGQRDGRTEGRTDGRTDGGTDGRTDGRTDRWADVRKFTPVSYSTSALWGRCPKRPDTWLPKLRVG